MVEVTQRVREAAIDYLLNVTGTVGPKSVDAINNGEWDDTPHLQVLAALFEAGRRAGLEEAAGKCPARHSMHGCPMSAKIGG